ncbi:ferric reductase-like transmembrane domain-containing protein [Ferrovibrio sp.]|uniref:ferric reductase-like transmembrane domain-containing protein n=1 Tax=Ferrovibrio sp. TaxID=1917215 RepID=UPI003D0B22C4
MPTWISRWRLAVLLSLLLTAMTLAILWSHGGSVEGYRVAIRATARTSLLLFLLAYTASALAQLYPGTFARRLLRERRALGLSFAASHALHLYAIIVFWNTDPVLFGTQSNTPSQSFGSIAYLFIALMALTSNERAVRWLGPKRWSRLHAIGGLYIWGTFVVSFAKRAPDKPLYWAAVMLLLAVMVLRLWASRLKRRPAAAAA